MFYKRILQLDSLLKKKSLFLLGPRATGKSALIRHQFGERILKIDLLKSETFFFLGENPSRLEELIRSSRKTEIAIDEVQKLPILLNEVHRLIEEKRYKFILTGSSARKLKEGHANLLAGRAWPTRLFPLVSNEIPDFDLNRYLRFGGLPAVYQSSDPVEDLDAYANTYLREEIMAEGITRNLPRFAHFLKLAALTNTEELNYSSIASDVGVKSPTVREYFNVLEDTLIGFRLEPWGHKTSRKSVETAKFYFFDTGVTHTLAQTKHLDRNSDLWGNAFEQFIINEVRAFLSYRRIRSQLTYWRTYQQDEVDLIIGDEVAIEIKATQKVASHHLKGLGTLSDEHTFKRLFLVSNDPISRKQGKFEIIHWKEFLQKLWADQIKVE